MLRRRSVWNYMESSVLINVFFKNQHDFATLSEPCGSRQVELLFCEPTPVVNAVSARDPE